jgi:hypothetical protein
LPTNEAPSVPAALLERAVARRGSSAGLSTVRQWAISNSPRAIIPLSAARPLDRSALDAWLDRTRSE